MYTLSTCPWCRKTKKYFTEHHVEFDYTDYDLADEATQDKIMRELDAEGASGFPFVRIGDQIVEGYRPDRFAELLGI
jgi:glutaredoxin